MSQKFHRLLFLVLLISPTLSMAQQVLRIGVGNFPPFFIEKENKGLFLDITKAIFQELPEYRVKFIFMSNSRLLHEINRGKLIDVACNIFSDSQVNAHLSKPLFRYTDVAVSRKKANLVLNKVSDLQGKSIAAYQGATELLGDEFKQIARENTAYSEHSHPKETTFLMVTGSKDVRIGDIHIFGHDLKSKYYQMEENELNINNFTIHNLWPDVYSHIAFKDKDLRNTTNKIIQKLTADGSFERIYAKYQLDN